jgi:hypothetical protein
LDFFIFSSNIFWYFGRKKYFKRKKMNLKNNPKINYDTSHRCCKTAFR